MASVNRIVLAADKPFSTTSTQKIVEHCQKNASNYNLDLVQGYKNRETDLFPHLSGACALIVRSDKVDEVLLDAAGPTLKCIVRAGAGYDTIDTSACRKRGIAVFNTPGQNSNAVAELVFGLLIHVMRRGFGTTVGFELRGKLLGLHGFGAIGKLVADIAKNGFHMNVCAYDPFVSEDVFTSLGVTRVESLSQLYTVSDVVSIHTPLNSDTRNCVSTALLANVKNNLVLVNTARAEVIDEKALFSTLESHPGMTYCADVAPKMAKEFMETFKERVFFTQVKCGAQTDEANTNCGTAAISEIYEFLENGVTTYQVNK